MQLTARNPIRKVGACSRQVGAILYTRRSGKKLSFVFTVYRIEISGLTTLESDSELICNERDVV